MTIYAGVKDGQIFTRDTKTKNYDYVVIGKKPIHGDANPEEWNAINWCGRLDLARTKAKEAGKYWSQVEIIPVFEKSVSEVTRLKMEIEGKKRAEEEALQAAEEARAAEMEMYVKASQDEQDEITGYDAAIDAAFDLAEIQRKEAEAREFEDAQKREAALIVEAEKQNQDCERAEWLAENIEEEAEEAPQVPEEEEEEQPEKLGQVPYSPSLICKCCGKLLTGPESIARGYGDKCWRKVWKFVRGTQEPEQPKELCRSMTSPKRASETLEKIHRRITDSEETCICGRPAWYNGIYSYDHDAGYMLAGFEKPQWVFTKCEKCGYEFSLRKMHTVDIEDMETEGRREAGVRLAEEEARKAGQAQEARK